MAVNRTAYIDIKEIFDAALVSGGGEVQLANKGQAVRWRQRAFEFRKLMREEAAPHDSVYDRLTCARLEPGDTKVILKKVGQKATFSPAAPPPPKLTTPIVEDDDPLLSEAAALRDRLLP